MSVMARSPFRNIGPKTLPWLHKVGVKTPEDLERLGPKKVYEMILAEGYKPHKALLYALIGARYDKDWVQVARDYKTK